MPKPTKIKPVLQTDPQPVDTNQVVPENSVNVEKVNLPKVDVVEAEKSVEAENVNLPKVDAVEAENVNLPKVDAVDPLLDDKREQVDDSDHEVQEPEVDASKNKKKKEKNVDIANNALHRLARKAGADLISNAVYYIYAEVMDIVLKRVIKKSLALSTDSGNKIIKRDIFIKALYLETGKYPIATIQSGKKAHLPNFKSKRTQVVGGGDDTSSTTSTSTVRVNPGRIAEKEIHEFQKQYDVLYMAKTPFQNKVKLFTGQAAREIGPLYASKTKGETSNYMFQRGVLLIAQSFIEQFLLDLTQNALKLTKHASRRTLYYEDIILTLEIVSNMGNDLIFPIDDIKTRVKINMERDNRKK